MRNLLSRVLFLVCAAMFLVSPALAGTIVFFGDSLTAGLGVEEGQAFPALIEEKIQAERLPFSVVKAGVSGDTSAGGLRRVDWLLQQPIDILVLELGANDGLRGLPVSTMKTNLQTIINKVKTKNPKAKIVVAGMRMPPNLGGEYADNFREAFVDLARSNKAALIPFLLDAVAGHLELNQADQIHPTAAGQKIVAENVWRVLEPLLKKNGS